jgi:putative membrane protein
LRGEGAEPVQKAIFLTAAMLAALVPAATRVSALPLVRLAQADAIHRGAGRSILATSDYVKSALMSDKFEIAAARIAQGKSRNSDVQHFAQMMIQDHGATSDELTGILKQNAFAFTPPADLDDEHAAMVRELGDTPAPDFDRHYIQQQIDSHQSALRVQSAYVRDGRDQVLRKYAAETAPKIRAHLELARKIFSAMSRIASRVH